MTSLIRNFHSILLLFLLILNLTVYYPYSSNVYATENAHCKKSSTSADLRGLTPHKPIVIEKDSDFNPENGVTRGKGTPDDPYIIENWVINASDSNFWAGIFIHNTNAYFVIRNCYIHSGLKAASPTRSGSYGIWLQNAKHGVIENVIIEGNKVGILIDWEANYIIIRNCEIKNNSVGIEVERTAFNQINITCNKIMWNDFGLIIRAPIIVSSNTIFENKWMGILIGSNVTVINNSIYDHTNGNGICIEGSYSKIIGNRICGNSLGIGFSLFEKISNNVVMGNDICNNKWGIYLRENTTENYIFHNNFIDNDRQIVSLAKHPNYFDDGYPSGGNYWSDYAGADLYSGPYQNETGSDGIGDTPYQIDQFSRDRYPLMKPFGKVISLTVTPYYFAGPPGSEANFIITITNIGEENGKFTLLVSDKNGWSLPITEMVFKIPANSNQTIKLNITLPGEAKVCNINEVIIKVKSGSDEVVVKRKIYVTYDYVKPSSPIHIEGNYGFTQENGVVRGNGTAENPYVIEGLDISADNGNGIEIIGTDAYFVIRNCLIHEANNGILLKNVRNARIEKVFIVNVKKYGISLYSDSEYISSRNNHIDNCTFKDVYTGVYLSPYSDQNIISNCTFDGGTYGIVLDEAYYNLVTSCKIRSMKIYGVQLYIAHKNVIERCTIMDCGYGIGILKSLSNYIFHNNFIRNTIQVDSINSKNYFDDGYPSGGNYWSDYAGADLYSGPYQNETGSDGIGDTPYVIDANNTDRYPLIEPYIIAPQADVTMVLDVDEEGYVVMNIVMSMRTRPGGGLSLFKLTLSIARELIVLNIDIEKAQSPFNITPILNRLYEQLVITGSTSEKIFYIRNCTVAVLRLRLNSTINTAFNVKLQDLVIVNATSGVESNVAFTGNVLQFLRGDANSDGRVSIADAMFIAQFLAGNRPASDLNLLNAASVKHDSDRGDKVTIADAMFIAQYLAGLRDEYMNLRGD